MMQTMRKNMKVVLWILVLAFIATIVFSWGMGGFKSRGPQQGIAATINGREISVEKLEELFQQRYQYEQKQKDAEITDEQVRQMRTQVWDELIRDMLIEAEVKRLGIRATDQEIANLIQNVPPDFIRSNENFQTDGQFDPQKYQQYLSNPAAARDLVMLEQSYRKTLPSQKFVNQLLSQATVSDAEAWQSFSDENLRGKARYALIPAAQMTVDSAAIPTREIQAYYEAHRDDYRVPEKRRLRFVLFPIQPSREDSTSIFQRVEEVMQRVRQGDDFTELAKEYSEDRTAENGGDLGYFEKGQMVPEFEAAAFSAAVGQVVGPVLTRFGYHIIKVTDRKTEEGVEKVRASHLLLKIQTSMDTREQVRANADAFVEELLKVSFEQAARAYELQVDTTEFFERGYFIPGLGRMPAAVDYIFSRLVDENGPIYSVRDGLVVFNIFQVQRERPQELVEVKSQIVSRLVIEKKVEQALERGRSMRQGITDPSLFIPQVEAAGFSVKETEQEFQLDDYLPDVGRDLAFTAAALALEPNAVSPPVKGMKGCYLIQLTQKSYPDSSAFLLQRDEIRNKLLTTKQNEVYTEWLETAKKKANLQDFRYLYYRDY